MQWVSEINETALSWVLGSVLYEINAMPFRIQVSVVTLASVNHYLLCLSYQTLTHFVIPSLICFLTLPGGCGFAGISFYSN
jgi:hypothetical protein